MNYQNLYSNNLNFFQSKHLNIYNTIQAVDKTKLQLILDNQDVVNFKIHNNIIFSNNIDHDTNNEINKFISEPTAFMKQPQLLKIEDYGDESLKENYTIHHDFIKEIEKEIPLQTNELSKYHQHLDSIPVLIIFGLGSGKQIEQLIKLVDIKNIIVVDFNFDSFYCSLYTTHWENIFSYFARDGYSIDFKISEDELNLSHSVLNEIDQKYRHYIYYIPFYLTFITDKRFTSIINAIYNKYSLLFTGWGFYDDEKKGLINSLKNMNNSTHEFLSKTYNNKNSTVFIIGSGPSIDNDLEFIKNNLDNVIIFSCGSSLKILQSYDIVPDFHIEIERTTYLTQIIRESFTKEYTKQINLLTLNVVEPDVLRYFKSAKIFFKQIDTSSCLLHDSMITLNYLSPTAVNAAFTLSSFFNIKNIYLFGTDMGFYDKEYHHSKKSAYNDKKKKLFLWKPTTNKIMIPSNFDLDRKLYTTEVFKLCKTSIENCIQYDKHNDINYYNCSDGAHIKGIKAIHSKDIKLEKMNKKMVIKQITSSFIKTNGIIKASMNNKLHNELVLLEKTLTDLITFITLNSDIKSYSDYFFIVNTIFNKFPRLLNTKNIPLYNTLLKGTITNLFSTIYTHSLLSKDLNTSFMFINKSMKIILKFLNFIKSDLQKLSIDKL